MMPPPSPMRLATNRTRLKPGGTTKDQRLGGAAKPTVALGFPGLADTLEFGSSRPMPAERHVLNSYRWIEMAACDFSDRTTRPNATSFNGTMLSSRAGQLTVSSIRSPWVSEDSVVNSTPLPLILN